MLAFGRTLIYDVEIEINHRMFATLDPKRGVIYK